LAKPAVIIMPEENHGSLPGARRRLMQRTTLTGTEVF
jgi:hypothetical protein